MLQELERMRIPIDAIVGTSMGAIVGGLYASGMTTAELETTVATLDWADALSDRPERKDLSFRRKQEDEKFPINFEVGFRDGRFQFPQGLIQGHKLGLVLRELTIHASDIRDFDDLPVPFRAIASDIVGGDIYVMVGWSGSPTRTRSVGKRARLARVSWSMPRGHGSMTCLVSRQALSKG